MGRKNRKPVLSATKSVPSSTNTEPDPPVSAWEAAKNKGNLLYGQNQYDEALVLYVTAIGFLKYDTSVEGMFD